MSSGTGNSRKQSPRAFSLLPEFIPNARLSGNTQIIMVLDFDPHAAPDIENIEYLALIGEGGMSRVYKARQKLLDRIVAVKILSHFQIAECKDFERFQQEAKYASKIHHPNIAKTISFGVTEAGQPYLIMEFVEGISLAEELNQNGRLSLGKFRSIFLPLLSALAQTHSEGIVHRDLKSGNIMLCKTDSGEDSVKLVDFGIAKAIAQKVDSTRRLTKSGALIGSPAYMSPEQCLNVSLDGRSDLYSLACIMYETLTGFPPFSGNSPLEVMQKQSEKARPTAAELCHMVDIPAELAEVIIWGLAKNPDQRPVNASAWASKLSIVLEGYDLEKVPVLRTTRLQKIFSKRQVTVLICACSLIGALFVMRIEFKLKTQIVGSEAASVLAKSKHNKLVADTFYEGLLEKAEKEGDQSKITKFLDKLVERYTTTDQYLKAAPLAKRCLEIREEASDHNDIEISTRLFDLAELYRAQGKYAEAEPLYKRCLEMKEKKLGLKQLESTRCLVSLADNYMSQAKHNDALTLYKQCLKIKETSLGPTHPEVGDLVLVLANLYKIQHKQALAEPLYKRCIQLAKTNSDQICLAWSTLGLAELYHNQSEFAKAEPLFRKYLNLREVMKMPDDLQLSSSLSCLATACFSQKKYTETESACKRSLQIRERLLPRDHPDVTQNILMLASAYIEQGNFTNAEPLLKRCLENSKDPLASKDLQMKRVMDTYAKLLHKTNRSAEAAVYEGKAREIEFSFKNSKP